MSNSKYTRNLFIFRIIPIFILQLVFISQVTAQTFDYQTNGSTASFPSNVATLTQGVKYIQGDQSFTVSATLNHDSYATNSAFYLAYARLLFSMNISGTDPITLGSYDSKTITDITPKRNITLPWNETSAKRVCGKKGYAWLYWQLKSKNGRDNLNFNWIPKPGVMIPVTIDCNKPEVNMVFQPSYKTELINGTTMCLKHEPHGDYNIHVLAKDDIGIKQVNIIPSRTEYTLRRNIWSISSGSSTALRKQVDMGAYYRGLPDFYIGSPPFMLDIEVTDLAGHKTVHRQSVMLSAKFDHGITAETGSARKNGKVGDTARYIGLIYKQPCTTIVLNKAKLQLEKSDTPTMSSPQVIKSIDVQTRNVRTPISLVHKFDQPGYYRFKVLGPTGKMIYDTEITHVIPVIANGKAAVIKGGINPSKNPVQKNFGTKNWSINR